MHPYIHPHTRISEEAEEPVTVVAAAPGAVAHAAADAAAEAPGPEKQKKTKKVKKGEVPVPAADHDAALGLEKTQRATRIPTQIETDKLLAQALQAEIERARKNDMELRALWLQRDPSIVCQDQQLEILEVQCLKDCRPPEEKGNVLNAGKEAASLDGLEDKPKAEEIAAAAQQKTKDEEAATKKVAARRDILMKAMFMRAAAAAKKTA